MTFNQAKQEIIQIMSDAMKNSGRTCDEDSWSVVMAEEVWQAIYKNGYSINLIRTK